MAIVVAPAGYGKSAVLDDAFGDIALRVEFAEQESVEGLARALIAAAAPQFSRRLAVLLARPPARANGLDAEEVAAWVVRHLRSADAPIVLDDFHTINDRPELVRFIERVITATIPHVRWVIASRETPRLPVGTWVAHGMAMPIVGEDLAFSTKESIELAAALGISIGAQEIRTICTEAEGWPLVIRLALGAWERTRSIVPLRIRTRSVLYDFLEEQVWSYLTEDDRCLLFAAAALRDTRPAFLSRVGYPDAGPALDRLGRKLPLDGGRTFRLHDVIREFVLERHAQASLERELLASAIDAYVAAGEVHRALEVAVQRGVPSGVRELLAQHACDLLDAGYRPIVAAAVAAIKGAYAGDSVLIALRSLIQHAEGNDAAAEAGFVSALNAGDLPPDLESAVGIPLAELYLKRGDAAAALRLSEPRIARGGRYRLDWLGLSAAAFALAAVADLAAERIAAAMLDLGAAKAGERARHLLRLSFAYFYLGDVARAETFAHDAAELADTHGRPSIAARAFSILYSVATTIHADGLMALQYARQWSRFAEEAGEKSTLALGLVAVLAVAAEMGDDATFEEAAARLRPLRAITAGRHQVPLRYARAVYQIGQGNLRNAILAIATLDGAVCTNAQRAFRDAMLGMLYVANGERDVAEALLRKVALGLAGTGSDFESRQYFAFSAGYRALGLWMLGRQSEAQRSFAMHTAEGLGERDTLTLGAMRAICCTAKGALTGAKLDEICAPLTASGLDGFARLCRTLIRPAGSGSLTRTELAVLAEYRRGSSTAEIASRLNRSPKTLYNHIDSASRKLGVSGRAALLSVVVDQGLID